MKKLPLAATLAVSLIATPIMAAELLELTQLLASESAKETLKQGVAVYWVGQTAPTFSLSSLPETYTSTSFSPSPFGGSRRHCVDAFEKAFLELVKDAKLKGFDTIVDMRPVVNGNPEKEAKEFTCKPGYKITTVSLMGTLAMSEAAAKRVIDGEQSSLTIAARLPAEGAIYLKLEPTLTPTGTTEAISKSVQAYAASPSPPAYRFRFGPDDYSGDAELTAEGPEAACRRAVAKALEGMAAEAVERKYSMLINIRSNLNSKYSPDYSQFECLVGKKNVSVNLQVTFAAK